MQQGGGGGGGGGASSQYGVSPEMAQFATTSTGGRTHMVGISSSDATLAEAASPITSRPQPMLGGFEESVPVAGGFQEEEALAVEEAERGPPGHRWPRQETVALLKIRSEMDADFREATLKGPLWEDVSRKLAELGYQRSAKKCKEKFENVHKYYKRTKEGRAGRQDGKSYRFFTQLEALHAATTSSTAPAAALAATPISVGVANPVVTASTSARPLPVSSTPPAPVRMPDVTGISFSSNSEEEDESEEEMEEGGEETRRKRKRSGGRSGGMGKKMKGFFEGVMRQVMERQEAMQQRFLEAIEKREQDRMIREEAWRRQEMARLSREHELMTQERARAASRDAAVIAFLQKITGQTIQLPPAVSIPAAPPPQSVPTPPPAPQPVHSHHHQQQISALQIHTPDVARRHQAAPSSVEVVTIEQNQEIVATTPTTAGGGSDATSSRWPKAEVLALIKLRSGLESKYQEAGPKGPLWEEISAGMQRMGYKRSSKRCKEKWENINKYFKKVKESNKKRPEDAKTCPYFHELDALYRKKILGGSSAGGGVVSSSSATAQQKQELESIQNPISTIPKERSDVGGGQSQPQAEAKNGNSGNDSGSNDGSGGGGCSSTQVPTSNGGGASPSFFGEEATTKKPEDIVKELIAGHHRTAIDEYDKLEDPDCSEEEDDMDDEVNGKMTYEIQFQRPNTNSSNGGSGNVATTVAGTADSFLTMVQ